MAAIFRFLAQLPGLVVSPVLAVVAAMSLLSVNAAVRLFGKKLPPGNKAPRTDTVSVVIPNWNGRELLEKYLPSVLDALRSRPGSELIVVDNGSTDGSAAFVREAFPEVRLLALPHNLGFGGGSNHGFREARNDVVVLLNSDMRVAPGFLNPLLEPFSDPEVFAVTSQIFFSDTGKKREETGLTHAWWAEGSLRVRHVVDEDLNEPFPCFYGGGGSTAFDRAKFLELGGFDRLLEPFYLEDTDLGFLAWKRGWKVLYQPASHVWHEHRGTIGRKFNREYIDNVIRKNFLLFAWKNIHEPARLLEHFAYAWAGTIWSALAGFSLERPNMAAFGRAFSQLPGALASRWNALRLAVVSDSEAFRRTLGGYYRDRFHEFDPEPETLEVVFLSPYPVCPPIHGGAVFMNQTLRCLGRLSSVHLIALVDEPWEIKEHDALAPVLASHRFLLRLEGQPKGVGALDPYAVREFRSTELEWLIHRELYVHRAHVLQIEYSNMGQYAPDFHCMVVALFEHDVYFQSIARQLPSLGLLSRLKAVAEYLRALRYELNLLPRLDHVQTCTAENRDFLLSFLPQLSGRVDPGLRAGILTREYGFQAGPRTPNSMLFLGSFRHRPNESGVRWFLREVMPLVLKEVPEATFTVVGSDPPPAHTIPDYGGAVRLEGFVEDIRAAMAQHAVFVCPILAGSGLRVKLLEAFACGIPVVSTVVGAEGLGRQDGQFCRLADGPREFARAILELFADPAAAAAMAQRARRYVEEERDIEKMTERLEITYRQILRRKAGGSSPDPF